MVVKPELQHGSLSKRETVAPDIGQRVSHAGMAIDLIPAKTYEVNFRPDVDVITLALGRSSGVKAFDSDKHEDFSFAAGEANFHQAGSEVYARCDSQNGEMVCVVADQLFRESVFKDLDLVQSNASGSFGNLKSPEFLRLASYGRRMFLSAQVHSRIVTESYLTLVLAEIARAINSCTTLTKPQSNLCLDTVLEYIEESLAENLSLKQIAQETGLSPYHFARLFREKTGLSPHQFVLERRVIRARQLLEKNTSTLADVAYAVGFSSQVHMTDVFQKRLGITPGAYRKEVAE